MPQKSSVIAFFILVGVAIGEYSNAFGFVQTYREHIILSGLIVFPLLMSLLLENDGPVSILFLAFMIFVQYFKIYDLFLLMRHYGLLLIPGFAIYLTLGTGTAMLKWYIYIRREREQEALRTQLRQTSIVAATTEAVQEVEVKKILLNYVKERKSKIVRWILYWPLALITLFCGELYNLCANQIFSRLRRYFVEMAADAVADEIQSISDNNNPPTAAVPPNPNPRRIRQQQ